MFIVTSLFLYPMSDRLSYIVISSQSERQLRRTCLSGRRKWRGTNSNPWSTVPHTDGVHSLKKLKEKLKIQRQHLDELDKHIKELEKDSGGEQH
jgi:hypothetical protein